VKESQIQYAIRLALGSHPRLVLWRNNTGVAKFKDQSVRYGLCVGSSDLIGILDMPCGVGRFIALECKTAKGAPTREQVLFLELVRKRGGFAAIVRSPEEALRAVERALAGATE
jgi:hypothetical protein